MSDVNVRLGQQTLAWQVAEQKWTVERHRLQIVEMHDRIMRNNVNIAATAKAIEALRAKEPDTQVGRQRVAVEIASLEHTIARQRLESMEAQERCAGSLKSITAAENAAMEFAANLADMNAVHGEFTTTDFKRICEEIENG